MRDHLNWRAFFSCACWLLMFEAAFAPMLAGQPEYVRQSSPAFLSYPELVSISDHDEIPPTLNSKLIALLTTPFVNNEAFYRRGCRQLRFCRTHFGPQSDFGRSAI